MMGELKQYLVNMPVDLVAAIDAQAGPRGRSKWVTAACEAALADGGPTPEGEAAVWQATAAAILEAWRQERAQRETTPGPAAARALAHGGNGNAPQRGKIGAKACEKSERCWPVDVTNKKRLL